MDRRQRKTRNAIFKAFIELLSDNSFEQITVGEIIEAADIGRATFYAHFETKDYLLKELCRELFCHIADAVSGEEKHHNHIFDCNAPDSAFLHLILHLQKNDNNILDLLSGKNNELFLRYFKTELKELIKSQLKTIKKDDDLPESFLVNHIASTFVETIRWWLESGRKESAEKIYEYFLKVT